jgi:hypothetical protein
LCSPEETPSAVGDPSADACPLVAGDLPVRQAHVCVTPHGGAPVGEMTVYAVAMLHALAFVQRQTRCVLTEKPAAGEPLDCLAGILPGFDGYPMKKVTERADWSSLDSRLPPPEHNYPHCYSFHLSKYLTQSIA